MTKSTIPEQEPVERLFEKYEPQANEASYVALPVDKDKRPATKGWTKSASLSPDQILARRRRYANHNIGILAGTPLKTGRLINFVDIDDDRLVSFVKAVISPFVSGKIGGKGLTIAAQGDPGLKSKKIKRNGHSAPVVEFFCDSGMVVVPPSTHPTAGRYRDEGKPLFAVEHNQLPILNAERMAIIEHVATSEHAWGIIEGGADVKAHDAMLKLTSSGIANLTDDLPWLASALNQLFHPNYRGNTKEKTFQMLMSAKAKGLGLGSPSLQAYAPGAIGPIPLGYTKEGNYALRDQVRRIVVIASAGQLLNVQFLMGLAPSSFWAERFKAPKAVFNALRAGEALIAASKRAGPFNPLNVRGRGIWWEGNRVIENLGEPVPADAEYLYLCFAPIKFDRTLKFDTERLLYLLRRFNWRHPQDAMLLLGWLALAPICGVLTWRPHAFLYGPPRCGKTTLHSLASNLLRPLVVSADGQSSEAGIRQLLGPDSLPVIIDEFESDQDGGPIRRVLRLARSASSADNPVLRGTPEGRAMQFSLRTTFLFSAVNPGRMTPADQSRILLLELQMHNNDSGVAREIIQEEGYFKSLGSAWSGYMVSLAQLIGPALDTFETAMPSSDRRHRQNMATLLASAFVALNARAPTTAEAEEWANEYTPAVELHAQDTERDDAFEALDYLFAHLAGEATIGEMVAKHYQEAIQPSIFSRSQNFIPYDRELLRFDIIVRLEGEYAGVLIRNGSPAIEKVFRGTKWEGGAWQRAIRKLEGAFFPKNPVQFAGPKGKARCIGVPLSYIAFEPDEDARTRGRTVHLQVYRGSIHGCRARPSTH